MPDLPRLGERDLSAVRALCGRALADAPDEQELAGAFFDPGQPATLRGDPDVGVVATVTGDSGGHIRLLVVDPDHRGRGRGHELLAQAEADLAGQPSVTVGADAPFFLFPGVETTETAMLCLLERHHYWRAEANFNMPVDLTALPDGPGGGHVAQPGERDEVAEWMAANWANWKPEVLRALDKGNLLIERDEKGISAFCAYEVNRRGFLGPVAARPGLIGKGVAAPLLLQALRNLRDAGRARIEVVWVGPIVPYARVGGTVGRVFFVYKKNL